MITIKRITGIVYRVYKLRCFKKAHPNLTCVYNENRLYKDIIYNIVTERGTGNKIIIEEGGGITYSNIYFGGNNCVLHIGKNTNLRDCRVRFENNGGQIFIGDNTTAESGCEFASCEGKSVNIGNDCMLANNVDIRNTDSHSILNNKGERINPAADIMIGNHVWIGIRSLILKGAKIPNNCVVGAQSMVTSSLKTTENALIAGSPAKVIKDGINWDRKRI